MKLDMNKLVGLMECGHEPVNYGDGWKVPVDGESSTFQNGTGYLPVETTVILQMKRYGFCTVESEDDRMVARMRKVA